MKICPSCGMANEEDVISCRYCYFKFNIDMSEESEENEPTEEIPQEKIILEESPEPEEKPAVFSPISENDLINTEQEETQEIASPEESNDFSIDANLPEMDAFLDAMPPFSNPDPIPEEPPHISDSVPVIEDIEDTSDFRPDRSMQIHPVILVTGFVLLFILIIGTIILVSYIAKQKKEIAESDTPVISNTENNMTSQADSISSYDESDADFYAVLQNDTAILGGYLYDIDHDGNQDLIVKDPHEMKFILYTHKEDGNLYMCRFGGFLDAINDECYDVTGTDGKHYFYWNDHYVQRLFQGYFDPSDGKEVNLSIVYADSNGGNAEWKICNSSNDTPVNTGSETVTSIYEIPEACETSLMNLLTSENFQVNRENNYTPLTMMNYSKLCQKTAPDQIVVDPSGIISAEEIIEMTTIMEAVTTPEITTTIQTAAPAAPVSPPEISCEIKTDSSPMADGYSYTLYVTGDYDYYYIECNEYSATSPNEPYQILSGNKSDNALYLTAGSSLDHVTVSVTPYHKDGTKGKTVTCTAKQPESQTPKITRVEMPSNALLMGTGTPVSSDGFLNLRSSKSTSSDSNIITQIPNGAEITMLYIEDDTWIYVEYGDYSGYVKQSYTKLTNPQGLWADGREEENAVEVYSCNKRGEIAGNGVAGFTTSYVVDHGSKTTVRDKLGNRWHVTASHYCYSYGVTWYELYDTDDGDYYGWVDEDYISFYSDTVSSSEVYSCNKRGEIAGNGVAGFTTSYVVDHGSKTTVREELGNRWHVTAYRYCYAYGLTWYELYDTDDGDYYGWVDADYIDFY